MIAQYHRSADVVYASCGSANIGGVLEINSAGFATSQVFDAREIETLNAAFRDALARHASLLDRRQAMGRV
ncbi:hypothetical protein, partial [Serratia marcescens]|uniref:hypothetical protein n=1 Tax=Serratia marcescens TaxID=615 RepID=UPI001953C1D9